MIADEVGWVRVGSLWGTGKGGRGEASRSAQGEESKETVGLWLLLERVGDGLGACQCAMAKCNTYIACEAAQHADLWQHTTT